MNQTQREFLLEIEELVEKIFADLDELRSTPADDRKGRKVRELIDRIFRHVHSVKGSAASCGLEVVSQIAHEFENLLAEVRAGRVLIDDAVMNTCESATEALAESLGLAASGIVEPSRRELFDRMQTTARGKTGTISAPTGNTETVIETIPSEIRQTLTEPEKHQLASIVGAGGRLYEVTTSFDLGDFDAQFFRLKEKLAESGEVISTSPAVDDEHPDRVNFRVLFASEADLQAIKASVSEFPTLVLRQITKAGAEPGSLHGKKIVSGSIASASGPPSLASLSNFVRADLDKLDRLISSTHELLRTTSNALELALSEQQISAAARQEILKLNEHIRSSFMNVEDQLINLRMVSLGPTLQRAARAGRVAARLATKEIAFEISGTEILVDKLLVEAITDPLIQLVRNAVDHGIESSAVRLQGGKNRRGTVRIEAISEGSQVRLRVMDDGQGVDPLMIAEAASRLGLSASDPPLDLDRSLRLIFRPGFTTRASVSDVSGRGVGLDIVETAVEQVGGELRVSSVPNHGAIFEIRLPVTFGLIATNVVVSAGNHYCIPAAQTLGIDAIEVIDGASGADSLRQVSMRDLLGQSPEEEDSDSQLHLVTCQFSEERAGLGVQQSKCVGIVVDRVEGPQEVLVRSLGRHAGRWYGIAGATELKDGTVALVLDLPRLLSSSTSRRLEPEIKGL